jgi:hypothetical protein
MVGPSEVADRAAILAQKEAEEARFDRRMLVLGSMCFLVGVVIAGAVAVWEAPRLSFVRWLVSRGDRAT